MNNSSKLLLKPLPFTYISLLSSFPISEKKHKKEH